MEKHVQIILPLLPVILAMGIVGVLGLAMAGIESARARREGRHWFTGRPL